MKSQTTGLAMLLFIAVAVAGCTATLDPDKPVSEFPAQSPQDYRSRGGAILALCRWEPDTSPAAKVALAADRSKRTLERNTVVQQVSIDDGQVAGFRNRGGDLFAIAGKRAIPLSSGHYTWQLLSQDPRGHHSSEMQIKWSDSGLTDSMRDGVKSLDNKYNGQARREENVPQPDLGK